MGKAGVEPMEKTEFEIAKGPSNDELRDALFTPDGLIPSQYTKPVKFYEARDQNHQHGFWIYDVFITSARRRNPSATIWELEGIIETQGGKKRVSIYYLSDNRTGHMRIEDELHTSSILIGPDEKKRSSALLEIIFKMIHVYRESHQGNLNEQIFRLFEKAKVVHAADGRGSLEEAINRKA